MRDIERLQHELHARTNSFKRKLERAQQIIDQALEQIKQPYVAFSGGNDSYVVLDLLYHQGYQGNTLFGDDGADFPETIAFLIDTEARYGFTLRRIRCMQPWRDWCNEMSRPDLAYDPEAREAWGNPHTWDATWDSLKDASQYGYGGVFLGLLASESRSRSYALHDGWKPLYQVKSENNMWHCSPLATWNKQDIWAYIIGRDLPYNAAYDVLASLDVPLERRRVAPLTCFRTTQYGSHMAVKRGWPDLFNQLAATFPNMRSFV